MVGAQNVLVFRSSTFAPLVVFLIASPHASTGFVCQDTEAFIFRYGPRRVF